MIIQLDIENADRDLTSLVTVLTDTPSASDPMMCQGLVMLGDGAKDLDGTGGTFELVITVDGQTVQPSPQPVFFGSEVRSSVWTSPFPVPTSAEVIMRVLSPNAADTDVDVTAYLYDIATDPKLLSYIQLLARCDSAITTDNATELSEINADGGSGAGDYTNIEESLQEIIAHGNQAWLTGAGAGATASYTTTTWTRTVGDNDGGTASDTLTVDGVLFVTGELAGGGTVLQVDAEFDITSGEIAQSMDVWGMYTGIASHSMQVLIKDTVSAIYEPLQGHFDNESSVDKHTFSLSPGHTDTGTDKVHVRFLHIGASGIASHSFSVDKAQVNTATAATPAPSAASIADAVWDETATGHIDAGKAGQQLWTVIDDIPTTAEFEARTLVAAAYVVVGDTIAGVTLVGTCTTNSDMVGTNNAALASVLGAAVGASISADIAAVDGNVDSIKTQTDKLDSMITEDSAGNLFTTVALSNSTATVDPSSLESAMKAITGITAGGGGTQTWQTSMIIINAWVAGNWRVKPTDITKQELLDAEDGSVVLEQDLTRSPSAGDDYRDITVKI